MLEDGKKSLIVSKLYSYSIDIYVIDFFLELQKSNKKLLLEYTKIYDMSYILYSDKTFLIENKANSQVHFICY